MTTFLSYVVFSLLLCSIASSELVATLDSTSSGLIFSIQNTYPYSVSILRWNLPIDSRFGGIDAFHVYYEGAAVTYTGLRVKYAYASEEDYVVMESQSTLNVTVELQNYYDLSQVGTYRVMFEDYVLDVVEEINFDQIPRQKGGFVPSEVLMSNIVEVQVDVPMKGKHVMAPYPCSASEQNTIAKAAESLKPMIQRAQTVIDGGDSPTYLEWFGQYTSARHAIAKDVITDIRTNPVVAYGCDTLAGVYAYVYPSDRTHTVYLCSVFWGINVIGGFDTQAGTLLHELSHFDNIGATDDWVYGVTGARNLARSNPARAVNNADNFEYFGESQFSLH